MSIFESCGELLGVIGREGATRLKLESIKFGFFADKLDLYVKRGIIYVEEADDKRNDMFYLTSLGEKIWCHEISIKDLENGEYDNETANL